MTILTNIKEKPALSIRQTIGFPNQLADMQLGFSFFGDCNPYSGIYAKRKGKKRQLMIRERFYYPTQLHNESNDAARLKFGNAVREWQNMNEADKSPFRSRARKLKMTGFNLFIKKRMEA